MTNTRHRLWTDVYLGFVLLRLADWALADTNHTIDDADPQVTYFPPDQWSEGSTCSGCVIKLDPSHTFDGTWHDTSHKTTDSQPRYVQVQFTGTAVYVVNVLANAVPGIATTTNLQFVLDGVEDGRTFQHVPSDSPDPIFGAVVYSRDGLDNTEHMLTMQAVDTPDSVILFDYILYTVPDAAGINSIPTPSTTTITSISHDHTTTTTTSTATSVIFSASSSSSIVGESDRHFSSSLPSSSSSSGSDLTTIAFLPSSAPVFSSLDPSPSVTSSPPIIASSTSGPSSPVRSSTKPVGLIVGATIGGIGILAFIVALIFVLRKRASNPLPEKGDDGVSDASITDDGVNREHQMTQVPEYGSSVLLIGNPEHQPTSSSGTTRARSTSWISSKSSYPSTLSTPMRVPSISDIYSAPSEVREPAMASSQLLIPSRPHSEKSPTSPSARYVRTLPPLPHHTDMSSTAPVTTPYSPPDRTASAGSSGMYAQLAALQEEVDKLRLLQEAPPRYDQA